eukprot:m51a1_g11219 putative eukaryotic translation initiation factor 3 subunit d (555) ;mRNA; f:30553-32490
METSAEQKITTAAAILAPAAATAPSAAADAAPAATAAAAAAGRHFVLPEMRAPACGWGPCYLPSEFTSIPYQPFNKGDKLGRAADWNAGPSSGPQGARYGGARAAQQQQSSAFFFRPEEEDESFRVVEGKAASKSASARRGKLGGPGMRGGGRGSDRGFQSQRWGLDSRNVSSQVRATSVEVKPDWKVLEQFDFSALSKLGGEVPAEPADIVTCGKVYPMGHKFDRLTAKAEQPLESSERSFFGAVTTTDDPVIRELSLADQGAAKATVFATDVILAALMSAPRSLYPWDVVVVRMGPLTFLDKRPRCPLDDMSVSETANEPPSNDADVANSPHNLSQEATYVNQMYSQQVLASDGKAREFERPLPFEGESEAAPVAFRYRRWSLGEGVSLVARCEVNAYNEGPQESFVRVQAFNEWDLKETDWRKKLDTQRGAVLATELKNNSCKLARWTLQALLAGAQEINLGYVSRKHPKDTLNHVVLGTQTYKTKEFATQINLSVKNTWGILRKIIDACVALPDGRYMIVKDPMKPTIRIYDAPDDQADDVRDPQQVVLD